MRLKKSESNWCWANFKFEDITTFCFIHGMVGHGEKFYERIFDYPINQIERPYGAWMRAEPRRQNHSIGAKWLRQGGGPSMTFPAKDKGSNNLNGGTEIGAEVTGNPKIKGIGLHLGTSRDKEREGDNEGVGGERGLYGEPDRRKRWKTWDLLHSLARDTDLPWCVIGDLNNVTYEQDKVGGAHYPQTLIDGFNDAIDDAGLVDMDISSHQCTFERGRDTEGWMEIRLDRVLTNESWLSIFPMAKLYNLEGVGSDHSPIFLVPKINIQAPYKPRFRFENAWLMEPICQRLVRDVWQSYIGLNVQEKVKACSHRLEVWGLNIVDMVKNLFRDGKLNYELNATNIVLIPKKKNPATVRDLRPISLCNVLMKIITKVIANRMKSILDSVISLNQSAFMQGRLITDNVMVSYEAPTILHMLFADDSYLYCRANMEEANGLLNLLQVFEGASGQQGDKEVSTKTVAQSLPIYAMSVFLLPVEITRDIERTIAKYWWNSKGGDRRGIHGMSRDHLYKHKSAGGMSFQDFRYFNLAILGKHGLQFMSNTKSLATRLYKARYFPNCQFIDASLGNNPGFIWRSILEAKDIVIEGLHWRVGTGKDINILCQAWLLDDSNPYVTSSHPGLVDQKVSSLMTMDGRGWDEEILKDLFNERDSSCIRNIPIGEEQETYTVYWCKNDLALFLASEENHRRDGILELPDVGDDEEGGGWRGKLLWAAVRKEAWRREHNDIFWRKIWLLKAPPKLQSKQVVVQSFYPVCQYGDETIYHVVVSCSFAALCWKIYKVHWYEGEELYQWWERILVTCDKDKRAEIATEAKCKISVDAATFDEYNATGVGMIVRDYHGDVLSARTMRMYSLFSPEMAEALAIKEALSWVQA
ncbi:uncharacterized protein LOC141690929 [Apium graveolens]|uniref:uncharacterized protein LOC141690929 n=1 Tax=Apium graveolens TaxID=4045 RepID=UPI003D7B34FC